jgi:two-component system, OmpR family, response regulator
MRILIVDDDVHIRRLLRVVLGKAGHTVEEAASAEEVLRAIESSTFDLVLLDLILPNYGGLRLCRRLKEQRPTAPHVIIISGETSVEARERVAECGADDFIAKPFSPAELVERIAAIGSARSG